MHTSTAANWAAAAGTLFAGLVALFKEELQSLFFRPKFKVEIGTRPPFCVKTGSVVYDRVPGGTFKILWTGSIYYARLWIQFVTKVERATRGRSYEAVDAFVPSNLR
jgi:hypothetical protein